MPSTTNKRQMKATNDEDDDDFEIKRLRRMTKVLSFKQPPKKWRKVPVLVSPTKQNVNQRHKL